MAQGSSSVYERQRAVERVGSLAARGARDLKKRNRDAPAFQACTETLYALPPRRAPSALAHPDLPGRNLDWATGVAGYALYLARLHACEEAYCDGKIAKCAGLPYEVPDDRRLRRISLPATPRLLEAVAKTKAAPPPPAPASLVAALPALELRAHDGSNVWASQAIVRFGVRGLECMWIAAVAGVEVGRLTEWIRSYFAAFWTWAHKPDAEASTRRAARILALAHRIAAEAAACCGRVPLTLPRYPVYLRRGARRFLSLSARTVTQLLAGPLADLDADLGLAHGLEVVDGDAAPDEVVDHRIAFWHESPVPPNEPVILPAGKSAGAEPVRRGSSYTPFGEPPEHLSKVMALEKSGHLRPFQAAPGWFQAVRRATECELLKPLKKISEAEQARVRAELADSHAALVGELWDADDRQRTHQIAGFIEHYFELVLVPPLPTTRDGHLRLRRGDQDALAAVDWTRSEVVEKDTETRGTVTAVRSFGVRHGSTPLRGARVVLALGQPSPLPRLGKTLAKRCERLDWLRLDAHAVNEESKELAADMRRCSADFFSDRARERRMLEGWLRAIERGIDGDPDRSQTISRLHIGLLQRAAQVGAELSPFLTVTRMGNVTLDPSFVKVRYAYREDTVPLDVLGVLRTGLWGEDAVPEIIVSRGPEVPSWARSLGAAAASAPGQVANLQREFEEARDYESGFESAGWRAAFIGRLLRAAAGSGDDVGAYLQAVQDALSAAPDMGRCQLVPAINEGEVAGVELDRDDPQLEAGVSHWFTESAPAGKVISVDRPGLRETLADGSVRWHIPPRITVSAGRHIEHTRRVQPFMKLLVEWLELAPLTEAKRARYAKHLRTGALRLFQSLADEDRSESMEEAVDRLLTDPRGVLAFLCHVGCRDPGLLSAVEALAVEAGIPIEGRRGSGFAESEIQDLQGAPVLVCSRDAAGKGHIARGVVPRDQQSLAGVALGLIELLGRQDAVDPDVREARSIGDTLMSLGDVSKNLKPTAMFLATKVYSLLPVASAEGAGATARLKEGVRASLEPLGLSIHPIQPGDDVREHDGRYKPRPGAVNWRVRHIERPCLMQGGQVIQVGIVETD